jgi:hypothetical protein
MISPVGSGAVMPTRRLVTPRSPRPVLGYGHLRFQSAKPASKWMHFVAGLWSWSRVRIGRPLLRQVAQAAMLVALAGCSEIALSNSATPPPLEPAYVSLSAKYLQSTLKDARAYDGFEIARPRWVTTIKGWNWLTCVRFHDHGHQRLYAIFIQNDEVSDGRYAVETDGCEGQAYTQFDLISGELGRPTAPTQPPLY